jgi:glycosyltransferase 2 family protein
MKRKQILISLTVVAVLAALVYLQFNAWKKFDWEKFKDGTEGINYWKILIAVVIIYAADFLRAVRWKIFLQPTRPDASWSGLISPQYIGFAGLALLGRPGEFIRPYLIARRENVSVVSQIAIWFVERAYDIGAITLIISVNIFLIPSMRENYPGWRVFGYGLITFFFVFSGVLWAIWRYGDNIAAWISRRLAPVSPTLAEKLEGRLGAVSNGLHTVRNWRSFFQIVGVSVAIWLLVALAYRQVTHSFPADTGLPALDLPEVILLMGASIAGGVVQLPVVGGGSQLATIAVLSETFGYSDAPELAVSCGILLWLVTFMSVIPIGLILAHFEHVSLRRLTEESQKAEASAEAVLGSSSDSAP